MERSPNNDITVMFGEHELPMTHEVAYLMVYDFHAFDRFLGIDDGQTINASLHPDSPSYDLAFALQAAESLLPWDQIVTWMVTPHAGFAGKRPVEVIQCGEGWRVHEYLSHQRHDRFRSAFQDERSHPTDA